MSGDPGTGGGSVAPRPGDVGRPGTPLSGSADEALQSTQVEGQNDQGLREAQAAIADIPAGSPETGTPGASSGKGPGE